MTTASPTVLIVEDDCATRTFLADNLAADGYEPLVADTADGGRRLLAEHPPDLVVIDLGLPDGDGLELLSDLRAGGARGPRLDARVPVLILSGRAGELDRVRGFERGCDDYVVKPFSYAELRGRVAALLRRDGGRPRLGPVQVGALELDPAGRQVRVGGRPVVLAKKEFALLRALAADPTRVFTREELLRGVWGFELLGRTRTLDSHASRLRRKLSVDGHAFVVNVWGVGYRLIDGELS
ncbi:MAG: response regulator transcription factor [Solirubrobacteraceae bacterium]|jgi:DNA-binding response OmpR family regulator